MHQLPGYHLQHFLNGTETIFILFFVPLQCLNESRFFFMVAAVQFRFVFSQEDVFRTKLTDHSFSFQIITNKSNISGTQYMESFEPNIYTKNNSCYQDLLMAKARFRTS